MRRTSALIGVLSMAAAAAAVPANPGGEAGREGARSGPPDRVTFAEHVAPIIFDNCTECHRPGEAAPFTLMTFEEVRKRAPMIQAVIDDRIMPPWHPDPTFLPLKDQRVLTDRQIALIARWIDDGMPEGDPADLPEMPPFVEGWTLGRPDLVLEMGEAFEIPASGPDIFRNFVLPIDLPEDRWVEAIEFRPAARSVVHHSLFFLGDSRAVRALDEADEAPGFRGMRYPILGSLGGWAVGAPPRRLPEGLAHLLPAHTDLVLQTHFHPSGKAEAERSTVGIYFADGPPEKDLKGMMIPPRFGRAHIGTIEAGDPSHVVAASRTVREDVDLVSVGAHAHYLCTEMTAAATLPDGETLALFRIPRWDFNWQGRYDFEEPVRLPAGTRIDVELLYDNSAENPYNPTVPPVDVTFGQESTDEMGTVSFSYVAVDDDGASAQRKARRIAILRGAGNLLRDRAGRRGGDAARRVVEFVLRSDADGDGAISEGEATGRLAESFDLVDADGSGSLDRDELEAMARRYIRDRD